MSSFKSPPMSPLDMVISFAKGVGVVSSDEDYVFTPVRQWHAMHERHEADAAALRSALARVVEVEARANQNERDRRDAVARWQVAEAAERRLTAAINIYVDNDHKCDAMLRSIGLDDTVNVVPRLHELVETHRRLTAELAMARGALEDMGSEDEHGVPSTREWMITRAKEALATARGQP